MKPNTATRLAWSLWGLVIGIGASALVLFVLSRSAPYPEGSFGFRGFGVILAFSFGTVGAFVASQKPSNTIGWLFLAQGIGGSLMSLAGEYAMYAVLERSGEIPYGEIAAWVTNWVWIPVNMGVLIYVLQLFPNGRPISPRWKWALYFAAVALVLPAAGVALQPGPLKEFSVVDNSFGVDAVVVELLAGPAFGIFILAVLISAMSLIVRFRRSRGDERQQLKWFAAAAVSVAVMISLGEIGDLGFDADVAHLDNLIILSGLMIPVATGIGILRHRLYDIDLVINKALVYGALVVFTTVLFAALVIAPLVLIFGVTDANVVIPFVATLVIAVAFEPARRRAQRFVNRVVYGERASPYDTMAQFSHQVAGALSLDDVLPRMARTAAQGVGATHSRVKVFLSGGIERAAWWPERDGNENFDSTVLVRFASEVVGEISVKKSPGEVLSSSEERLLDDLASQAGIAMRNVRQADELRLSRQRIVAAQDMERRRMERDIHDGAQQQLVAMSVKLGVAEKLLAQDPAKARPVLEALKGDASETVETLRDLARGLYPPMLEEKGLGDALTSFINKVGISATVTDETGDQRFDSQVEGAVYFVIREALQNASKHAPDASISIRLSTPEGALRFEVADDGPGFDPKAAISSSGLINMVDRIEAIGGQLDIESYPGKGTVIAGRIPLS